MGTVDSEVDIANLALTYIGAERISSLSETSKSAQLSGLFYPLVRDGELTRHNWSFAITRQQLASPTETNYTDYLYQYQLPVDPYWLRTVKIDGASQADYEVEGRLLYCNLNEVELVYIYRVEDVRMFSPLFVDALALRLAAKLAANFTGKEQKVAMIEQLYARTIIEAAGVDEIASHNPLRSSKRWDEVQLV